MIFIIDTIGSNLFLQTSIIDTIESNKQTNKLLSYNIYTRSPLQDSPSFRTQPLENLSVDSVKKWIPEQPSPWRKS